MPLWSCSNYIQNSYGSNRIHFLEILPQHKSVSLCIEVSNFSECLFPNTHINLFSQLSVSLFLKLPLINFVILNSWNLVNSTHIKVCSINAWIICNCLKEYLHVRFSNNIINTYNETQVRKIKLQYFMKKQKFCL